MNVEQAVVLHYIGRDHQRAHHFATLGERQDQALIGRDRAENSPLYIRQLGLERVRRRLAGYGVELAARLSCVVGAERFGWRMILVNRDVRS